ncbi:MAG: hypothetical protein WC917_02725 [Bacilli bacterium]
MPPSPHVRLFFKIGSQVKSRKNMLDQNSQVKLNPKLGKENKLNYFQVESQIKFLQGKVLTVIDASYSDKEQRKAVKDLVKSAFSIQLAWILQLCAPETKIVSRDQIQAEGLDVDTIEAEAIVD